MSRDLLQKIDQWRHAFDGDEQGVLPTLSTFAWNYAAYMTIMKTVERAIEEQPGGPKINFMLLDLLAEGFWASAMLAVRRLLDRGPLSGPRGICSLRAIIEDVKACQRDLTRRAYVESVAGQPYDYELVKQKHWDFIFNRPPGPVWVPRELDYGLSERRHIEFDFLSGVAASARSPNDVIGDEVFERLEQRLCNLDAVATHATKYFAHAATDESRRGRVLGGWGPAEAKEALRTLVQTAELVGRWFLFRGVGSVLPTPQYDQFEFLNQPLWSGSSRPLQEHWSALDDEISQWCLLEDANL